MTRLTVAPEAGAIDDAIAWKLLSDYHEAMVAGDTQALGRLVDPDFTLEHITGYVQPRTEWFEVVRTRQFDYHRISVDPDSLRVARDGDGKAISIEGRGVFDATIQGTHRPWRLAFRLSLSRLREVPTIKHAAYTAQ
nr:nuclear transport factor 2 family protein [uncultured Albidiferax sp.]